LTFEQNLKELKLAPKIVQEIKRANRLYVRRLKFQRKVLDRLARQTLIQHYIKNGRKWDSNVNEAIFRDFMSKRHAVHTKLFQHGGEKRGEPDFDSP
jgi:hypothetical protein